MKVLIWFLRIIPSFAFGYGLIGIANKDLVLLMDIMILSTFIDLAGGDLLYFIGVIYFGLKLKAH